MASRYSRGWCCWVLPTPQPADGNPKTDVEKGATPPTPSDQKLVEKRFLCFTNPQKGGQGDKEECEAYKILTNKLDSVKEKWNPRVILICLAFEILPLLALTALLACSLTINQMKRVRFLRLRVWQWVMMAMVIVDGLSVIRFITLCIFYVVWKLLWSIHRDVRYFLKNIKRCVDVTLWLCLILLVWYVWFRPRLKHVDGEVSVVVARQVTRFLIALCLGSVLWVAKSAIFLWLEADVHYRRLCDRITSTIIQLHGLQILHNYGAWSFLNHNKHKRRIKEINQRRTMTPKESGDHDEEEKTYWKKGDKIWRDLDKVHNETVPIWILQRLCKEFSDQLLMKPLPIKRESITDDNKLMDEARRLFGLIKSYASVANDDKDDQELILDKQKLKDNFGLDPKVEGPRPEVDEVSFFTKLIQNNSLDENEPGKINRDKFCSWVIQAYRNCWGLECTLMNSEHIIIKLNRIMIVFVLVLSLIIWLLLSDIVDSGQIALLFSPLLAAKFMFSDSSKNMFDGLIFALAMHPFKAGDRVIIDGMQLLVREMNILTTTFFKYETGEELIYPNSELAITHIINLELIPDESDHLEFSVPYDSPLEDIKDLELKIKRSLDERYDASNTKVVKAEMTAEDIKMTAQFNYVVSNLMADCKAVQRSEMLSEIMDLLEEMKKTRNPPAPLTCKPYIVEVEPEKKMSLKQIKKVIRIFKDAGSTENFKVVLNDLKGKDVELAVYAWSKEPQEQQDWRGRISDIVDKLKKDSPIRELKIKELKLKDKTETNGVSPTSSSHGLED